ncbi:hypothetical protein ROS62_02460 [Streptomyces sp. DSM 41972]|uniref:Uncharacterized protein n=1 Tax=Streptomyces althioticus subsp. attaecolombicae TaxID=3075534 RepID=A0ABU3HSY3_9ACTN|nr:hypothetical protein [Streptomyces sp. DSM 41972]SCD40217.1 hypothetical protein GA0115238_107240 [Streptomyces sp. di50b]SCE47133.1 hypothetical protein GA0115245_143612 [Streptomyces sp. di188]
MVLHYPVPERDVAALPVTGPHWPLSWDGTAEGEMVVQQSETGHRMHLRPVPGRSGAELPLVSIRDRLPYTVDAEEEAEGAVVAQALDRLRGEALAAGRRGGRVGAVAGLRLRPRDTGQAQGVHSARGPAERCRRPAQQVVGPRLRQTGERHRGGPCRGDEYGDGTDQGQCESQQ